MSREQTVLDAIIAAGGLADRASPCNIVLARATPPGNCRIVLAVCYRHIVQLGDTSTNFQIMPGDRVYVATRTLLEQLLPNNRKGCPLCCGVQCPCGDPSAAPYLPSIWPGRAHAQVPTTVGTEMSPEILQAPTPAAP